MLGAYLADGVTRANMWALLALATVGTAVISFLPSAQPHILTTILGLPESRQGTVVGLLNTAAELAMVASLAWYGALADRFGRRVIVVSGLVLCAAGTALFPFAANTAVLAALRVVFGLGVAAINAMLSTIAIDYVRSRSRGASYGLVGFFGGLGALVAVLVLVRLPQTLEAGGMEPVQAARTAFLLIAAGILVTAGLLWLTLSPVRPSPPSACRWSGWCAKAWRSSATREWLSRTRRRSWRGPTSPSWSPSCRCGSRTTGPSTAGSPVRRRWPRRAPWWASRRWSRCCARRCSAGWATGCGARTWSSWRRSSPPSPTCRRCSSPIPSAPA
ncbi:hypothetical protein B1L11_42485 [Microbispora sp. GKU 823]|nr:hypothetical protein B1L11_42485 [Microbispora sp. GKU 823]